MARGGREILREATVTVSARSRLGIVGENGRGKSALLHVLAGTLLPDGGSVTRAGTCGIAEQSLDAGPGQTVGTLVCEAFRPSLAALEALDAEALRTPVGALSAGQQSRLHLALRLAELPDILLLDEPSNHLSAPLVEDLTEALMTTPAAVVVATHDRQMLRDLRRWPRLELVGPREASWLA